VDTNVLQFGLPLDMITRNCQKKMSKQHKKAWKNCFTFLFTSRVRQIDNALEGISVRIPCTTQQQTIGGSAGWLY
jgi:hypothetical protein